MHVPRMAACSLLCLFTLSGCHKNPPAKPAVFLAPQIVLSGDAAAKDDPVVRALAAVVSDYQDAISQQQPTQAKIFRNRFIFGLMAQIEERYGVYEHNFRTHRAAFETLADSAQLGTTAAAAIVGSVAIKDMLAAANVAANGSRISVDKNFFNEQSTVALLTQMRASRGVVEAAITRRSISPVTDYTLEEAWKDLVEYYNAGTLESAMIEISANSGSENIKAKQDLAKAREEAGPSVAATKEDAINSDHVADIRDALVDAADPPAGTAVDPLKTELAAEAIRNILTKASISFASASTPAQLAAILQQQLDTAQLDRKRLAVLSSAILDAPKTFGGSQ